MDYAMSVIIGRALPDVRDGLKPAHRRVLYGMKTMGLASNRGYRKCAKIVGEVMGNFHPHGDASIYDTLVRLAQDFNMRYPLVDGQGNFGSIDGDPPAAMRYTEARLQALSDDVMADLDKETVDFAPNYDETTEEPTVLPAQIPNLLVNGSSGIAVGMATNIPPHNLREVIDGVIWAIETEQERGTKLDADEKLHGLMEHVKGPDFPDRRLHRRAVGHRGGLSHRTRRHPDAREGVDRAGEERRQTVDCHHGNSVSGEQGAAHREDGRPRQRQGHRRHLRYPRRIRSRGHARRHRAEARRSAGGHSQQPLQAHPAAAELRRHHARHRRRAPESAEPRRARRQLHRLPPRSGGAPHAVRAAQGRSAVSHPRRPEDCARQSRRGHQAHPRIEDRSGGARGPHHAVLAERRFRPRPSSTCSCSG